MSATAGVLADMLDPSRTLRALGVEADEIQRAVLLSTSPRLLLCQGRQVGKSRVAGHLIAHRTCLYDGHLTLIVSFRQEQSDELMLKAIESVNVIAPRLRRKVLSASSQTLKLDNGARIISLPGRNPDAPRSYTAHMLVMEEAAFTSDELFSSAVYSLGTTGGTLMALSSAPRHPRGWYWSAWTRNGSIRGEDAAETARDQWERYYYPSDRCPRISPAFLESARELDPERFEREALCKFPSLSEGGGNPLVIPELGSLVDQVFGSAA